MIQNLPDEMDQIDLVNDQMGSMEPMEPMEGLDMSSLEQMGMHDPNLLTPEEQESIGLNPTEEEKEETLEQHYRNLAAEMGAGKLSKIAQDLITLIEDDDESRKDWHDRVKEGIRNLGVSSEINGEPAFNGASTVVHPVLMESCTQFQARAIQELWPSGGPVQTRLLGQQTPEKQDQAQRVQDYMNYLYTIKMPEAFTQEDNMLLRLPISGSAFKKMYFDPLKDRLTSIFVEPADFIVSYQTDDLEYSPRFTHRIREYLNDVRKKEATGFYIKDKNRRKGNDNPYNESDKKPILIDEIDKTEGKASNVTDSNGDRVTLYEVYVDHDCEDTDEDGNPVDDSDGILKPYIITVDRDQQTVKRIQRNWKPDDRLMRKRMYFTHYKFTPGLGFYGYGFLHLIGDLSTTATGSLRALLDSAAFSNLQGGFKTRDSRIPNDNKPISPGEWREINSTAEELSKAFFPLPYKEPSGTMFQLLGYVDEKARTLAGITEITTGAQNAKDSPVGTTAMLLEQGTKVFTAIHKRIHEAHKHEFKIMAELIYENMPDEGYPYLLGTKEGVVMPQDFDERVDVIPISDPNISTNSQRVAKAQSILELQQTYPNVVNEREAVKRMLEAIQVQNIEALIGTPEDWARQDEEAAKQAEEHAQIEKQRMMIETQKLQAEADRARAETTDRNLDAMKSAFEASALATTNAELIEISDALLKSAGFVDYNDPGLVSPEQQQSLQQNMRPLDPGLPTPQDNMMLPQQYRDAMNSRIRDPNMMDPSMMDPSMMDPSMMDPNMMDPSMMDPSMMDPNMMDPSMMDPSMMDPSMMDPSMMDPSMMDPSMIPEDAMMMDPSMQEIGIDPNAMQ